MLLIDPRDHLTSSESEADLLAFGRRVGLKAKWLQRERGRVHFDVTTARMRQRVIEAGAREVTCRGFMERAFWRGAQVKHKMRVLVTRDEDGCLRYWSTKAQDKLSRVRTWSDKGVWSAGPYQFSFTGRLSAKMAPNITWASEPVPMTLMLMEPEEAERIAAIIVKALGTSPEEETDGKTNV